MKHLLLALATGFLLNACAAEPPEAPRARGVVWLVIDATAADHTSLYGNPRATTPRIAAFAEDATVFERAYCQIPWTLGSAASYMTGRYPEKREASVAPGQLLAGFLKQAGVRTAAFSENPYVTAEFGFDEGFDHFAAYFPYDEIARSPRDYGRVDSARTVDEAIAWITEAASDPFFAYVHLLPPHAPYDAPAPFGGTFAAPEGIDGSVPTLMEIRHGKRKASAEDVERLRDLYHENLAFADHQAGRLFDAIEALGLGEDTLVIVASDHGEAFLEHGWLMHGETIYEEVLRVPLVVRFPKAHRGERWRGVVELRQLFPTVCEAMGADCPGGPESLATTLARRSADEGVAYAVSAQGGKLVRTAIGPRWKLALEERSGRPVALYQLDVDPEEKRNLAALDPGSPVRELRAGLTRHPLERVRLRERGISAERRRQLEQLGYIE